MECGSWNIGIPGTWCQLRWIFSVTWARPAGWQAQPWHRVPGTPGRVLTWLGWLSSWGDGHRGTRLSGFKRSQVSGFLCVQFLCLFFFFFNVGKKFTIFCGPKIENGQIWLSDHQLETLVQWKPCWFPTRGGGLSPSRWHSISPSVPRGIKGVVPWMHPEVPSWTARIEGQPGWWH